VRFVASGTVGVGDGTRGCGPDPSVGVAVDTGLGSGGRGGSGRGRRGGGGVGGVEMVLPMQAPAGQQHGQFMPPRGNPVRRPGGPHSDVDALGTLLSEREAMSRSSRAGDFG
jgi:hypothetical protein